MDEPDHTLPDHAGRHELLERAVHLAARLDRILEPAGAPRHRRKTAALCTLIRAWVVEQTEEAIRERAESPMEQDAIATAAAAWRHRIERGPDVPGDAWPVGQDGED